MNIINDILFKKISAKGLAIFRIAYFINLLLEVIHLFRYRRLYFDRTPYFELHFPDTKLLFVLWVVIIFFIIIGLYTRVMTVLNYILTLVLVAGMTAFEYHMFYVYTGMNFLLIFLPIHRTLSVDLFLKKLKYLDRKLLYKASGISKINYLLPVFVGIGLVYFDSSIMFKMKSPLWLEGLGLWLPSSLPHVSIDDTQWFLNQEIFIKGLSYLTMVFEFMFVFLFWNKKYRVILLLIGIVLHLGILIQFPIPYFSIGYLALYILMVPVSFWEKIQSMLISNNKKKMTIYYDNKNISIRKFITLIEALDILENVEFVLSNNVLTTDNTMSIDGDNAFIIDEKDSQSFNSLFFKKLAKMVPLFYPFLFVIKISIIKELFLFTKKNDETEFSEFKDRKLNKIDSVMNSLLVSFAILGVILQVQAHASFLGSGVGFTNSTNKFILKNFGITVHPVFMDFHFKGYNTIYGVKYNGDFLPILDEKGMPGEYLSGGIYINWLFRVNSPYVKENAYLLRNGMVNYTSFWAHKNEVDLSETQEFEIVRKKIKVVFEWEKDLLNTNINTPWEEVGKLTWKNKRAQFFWNSSNKPK